MLLQTSKKLDGEIRFVVAKNKKESLLREEGSRLCGIDGVMLQEEINNDSRATVPTRITFADISNKV